ncbi:MAG: ATP-dependent DNA helicase RecG [Candidatus Omnitrophica bacterium]|nr:ATP-dependent DNA helicase RecG [Candidatus Omnitrophota bacterium]MCM8790371.1 ATP-dependent DNA helicase RecG [Candidatus Omnitrophota bacterium]
MQQKNILQTPVRYFKGVGPKRGEDLARLGIHTVEDILYYLPFRYEDRSSFTRIKDLKAGEPQMVQAQVFTAASRRTKSGLAIFQIAITDGTGFVHAVWFNQPYLKGYFRCGQKVVLYGRVDRYDRLQFVNPDYEILKEDGGLSINMGRIVPVYPSSGQLTQKYLRSLSYLAISKYARSLTERLPAYIIARQKLVDIRFAIQNIHFPTNFANLEKAYKRIVFEEFFILQLALAMKRKNLKSEQLGIRHIGGGELTDSFKRSLPFQLTDGQKKAMAEIERDMASGRPMNRLLEGDVGSGKTVVAAYALALTVGNGFQGVMMAPTEVLARQHFIGLSELLMPLGVNVGLLVGGMEAKAKNKVCSDIREGKADIVVGTHAVIQEAVEFRRLGLAVIDEQHKFGVMQRAILKDKGYNPHILLMTATPIPRTLALTVYGDLDISVIKELPKGRKPIVTYWVDEKSRDKVYGFIREELQKGRQAYVVCPLIKSSSQETRRKTQDAETVFEKLRDEIFSDYNVGLLHGKMTSKEKDKTMKDFKKGVIDVLVSTVVIEVGVDVPNATVMLVEGADYFGLAQLHQLRGRIGRGEHESYCILLADPKTEESAQRLKAIEGTLDGFEIAETDLHIRGPGEFFGTRQHGLPEIRFGNILKDADIMERARREAFAIVAADPKLQDERHRLIREALAFRFKGRTGFMNVA